MSLTNPDNVATKEVLAEFYQGILPYLGKGGGHPVGNAIMYGFRIDNSESSPSSKVTYLKDAIGMTPAYMDYSEGEFNYGSWEDAFFMPKPCMLKYDGTVDYYLDPNDYTKKLDGTASDVADSSYEGNAMMEWGQNGKKIWLKIVPDALDSNKSAEIYIANYKADNNFTDWPFHNSDGVSVPHFYTPIYNSSLIDSKFRSLSGKTTSQSTSYSSELTYAQANNPNGYSIWNTEIFADNQLIQFLCILITKSTNSVEKFGLGIRNNTKSFTTGQANSNGLFYGTNSSGVNKIFGMENYFGGKSRRFLGMVVVNGVRKVKMTYGTEDGSTTIGYNFTGEGYINPNIPYPTGTSGSYIKEMLFNEYGMFPVNMSGSTTTYYCNGCFFTSNGTIIPNRGGGSDWEGRIGLLSEGLGENTVYWNMCANLSCKPKA